MSTPTTAQVTPGAARVMPKRFFWFEITYLTVLIALFGAYETSDGLRDALPQSLGPIPVGVVWFGATGAVVAGIGGIYFHNRTWDPAYEYWHYSRPLVGAVVGGVGALLYYVSVSLGTKTSVTPNALTFDAVAFVLGFADDAFRELIKKITTLLFGAGKEATPPEGSKVGPGGGQG